MPNLQDQPAVLLLEDGTVFHGNAAGAIGTTTGELCFNTGMTGYQEVFTDPSYYGQILIMTNDHIGNYGIKEDEVESESIKISGMVCKNYVTQYSRHQADQSIQEYFERDNLVSISDVDTRAVVRHIRNKGAMNAIISSEELNIEKLKSQLSEVPSMAGLELSSKVSTKEPYYIGDAQNDTKIAVLDLGVKKNILRCFADRGCHLKVFPAKAGFKEMASWNPDGFFISNGPGDPAVMDYAIKTVREIMESGKPLFGICLGHQILALAAGVGTFKMHNGHRGLNHPVKNTVTGQLEITSQNHGFEVNGDDIRNQEGVEITHVNLNDETIEGIRIKGKPAFSVQYHPESSPGPHDSRYLFDDFIDLIQNS